MIRILTFLLAITMATTTSAWAGQAMPMGIALVGPSCCGAPIDADTERTSSQLEKACCCSPSPMSALSASPQLGPLTDDSALAPLLIVSLVKLPAPARMQTLTTPQAARAPPLIRSLYAQHTSLLI